MITDCIRVRETVVLDADANLRITSDGYLVCTPRVARTGIQIYAGAEVGKPHLDRVRVWRPEDEVFHKDAMATIAHRPITNDHPRELVTADNWKKYSVGQAGDEVARDGDFIRVPMCVMDAMAIKDIKDGKKEISLGYGANLEWRPGVTPQGEAYDAVQTTIRVNHIAVVDAARGGAKLVIGDEWSEELHPRAEGGKFGEGGGGGSREVVKEANGARLVKVGEKQYVIEQKIVVGKTAEYMKTHPGTMTEKAALKKFKAHHEDGPNKKIAEILSAKAVAIQQGDQAIVSKQDAALLELLNTTETKTMNDVTMRKMTVDSISIDVPELSFQVIQRALDTSTKIIADNKALLDAANAKVAELLASAAKLTDESTKAIAAKDAELATVKAQLKDAEVTPARLDQLVKDRAVTVIKAQAIIGDKLVSAGKTESEIRKQVVDLKLGDVAKGYSDDQVKISFDTLTAGVEIRQDGSGTANDAASRIANAFGGQTHQVVGDKREQALEAYAKRQEDAWKTPAGQA